MKKTIVALAIITVLWLVLPTGDPSDVLITLPLIGALGLARYIILAVLLIVVAYAIKENFGVRW